MAWGRESSRRIAGAPIVAALPWSLIWQGLGGRPWPRCSVAPGNLSDIGKPNSYGRVPHCMEFDSGGNGVRETSRTGLPWMIPAMSNRTRWLGNGDWPSFKSGARLDTNVSRQLQQQQQKFDNSFNSFSLDLNLPYTFKVLVVFGMKFNFLGTWSLPIWSKVGNHRLVSLLLISQTTFEKFKI